MIYRSFGWPTTIDSAGDVAVWKVVLPVYTAVIDCWPIGMLLVVSVAAPEVSVAVPRVVPSPARKVTVPATVPDPDAVETIAVSVIACSAKGLASEVEIETVSGNVTLSGAAQANTRVAVFLGANCCSCRFGESYTDGDHIGYSEHAQHRRLSILTDSVLGYKRTVVDGESWAAVRVVHYSSK